MSLVAYGSSSDESDNEELNNVKKVNVTKVAKKKEPVKIVIPSITKDDEDVSPTKQKNKSLSSSSLLSMLPPPKHSFVLKKSNLVPHVLTKNKEPDVKAAPKKVEIPKKFLKSTITDDSSEKDNANSSSADFFSLQNSDDLPDSTLLPPLEKKPRLNLPAPKLSETWTVPDDSNVINPTPQTFENSAPFPDSTTTNDSILHQNYADPNTIGASSSSAENSGNSSGDLDPKFVKWHNKFWANEEINIVDVDINQELKNSKEWRVKAISEEKQQPNSFKQPTQRQKKKHQITYLAFQAKERELDLKNQWAQNRLSRRQTQAKYGF